MRDWKQTWREGIAPLLTDRHLEVLRDGLARDDPALIQGKTTSPSAFNPDNVERPANGACVLGFCGWKGDGLETVKQISAFFNDLCHRVDKQMDCSGYHSRFIRWFDDGKREVMRVELLAEVELELTRRQHDLPNL